MIVNQIFSVEVSVNEAVHGNGEMVTSLCCVQLRDVMFALEAQQMAGASTDLQQATLLPVPPSPQESRARGRRVRR